MKFTLFDTAWSTLALGVALTLALAALLRMLA
jgi:hypothetical protein